MFKRGAITAVTANESGVLFAKVQISAREEVTCLLLFSYGGTSRIAVDGSSFALVLFPEESSNNPLAIPYNVLLQPTDLASGENAVGNFKVGNNIKFRADGSIEIDSLTSNLNISAAEVDIDGNVNTTGVYKVDDVQVVGGQEAAILDPTGGATVDAEARTAISLILTAMRNHGLISS